MQHHERACPAPVPARELAGRCTVELQRREQRLARDLADVADQSTLGGAVELLERQRERVADPLQQRAGDAALVALDQVEIRRRDADPRGESGLRDAERVAALADPWTDYRARHRGLLRCKVNS